MDNKDLIRIGLIILTGVVLMYLVNMYSKKSTESEGYDNIDLSEDYIDTGDESTTRGTKKVGAHTHSDTGDVQYPVSLEEEDGEGFYGGFNAQAGESMGKNEVFGSVQSAGSGDLGLSGNQYPKDCFPKDQLTPAELLPGDANSKWSQVNPAGQGELGDQNFLNAGYHVGVNTVGQTLRNANLQIRSEPPNPQVKVSPWLQSTIEPDTNRKPMEIGGCE